MLNPSFKITAKINLEEKMLKDVNVAKNQFIVETTKINLNFLSFALKVDIQEDVVNLLCSIKVLMMLKKMKNVKRLFYNFYEKY